MQSLVRNRHINSSDSHTYVEFPDGFKVYDRHGEGLFMADEIDTSPPSSVPPISLSTNDIDNRVPTNNKL